MRSFNVIQEVQEQQADSLAASMSSLIEVETKTEIKSKYKSMKDRP